MGGQKSHGVHKSSPPHSASSSKPWGQEPSRGSDPRYGAGPVDDREPRQLGRFADAEVKGPRDSHQRAKLGVGTPPGAHSSPVGKPNKPRRKRSSSPSRTEISEVENKPDEEQGGEQIGVRRRGAGHQAPRDATRITSKQLKQGREGGEVQSRDEKDSELSGEKPKRRRKRKRRSTKKPRKEKDEPLESLEAEEEGPNEPSEKRGRREEREGLDRAPEAVSPEGERKRKESSPTAGEQDGFDTEVDDDLIEGALGDLRSWLQKNDVGGLSVSQMGAHLVLQIHKSQVNLGRFMERMLAGPNETQVGERQRSILPLPCLDDSRQMVNQVIQSGEYKRLAGSWGQKKGMAHSKVHREMRKQGLLVWHFLVVIALNFMWGGMKVGARICNREASSAQKMALDRIWTAVRVFVDDTSETKEKFVKAPGFDEWKEKLEGVRVSYQGEIIPKAQDLTLEQILPGLPPEGYGGVVQLAELCDGSVKEKLMNPESCLLEGEELPVTLPTPRVMASEEEWNKIAGALYQRGLIRPVDSVAKVENQRILNGAFGVPKPGKKLEDGRDVLRLIMDFRAVNDEDHRRGCSNFDRSTSSPTHCHA